MDYTIDERYRFFVPQIEDLTCYHRSDNAEEQEEQQHSIIRPRNIITNDRRKSDNNEVIFYPNPAKIDCGKSGINLRFCSAQIR